MKIKLLKGTALCLLASAMLLPALTSAQNKAQYTSLSDAMAQGRKLRGRSGPQSVNWINGGSQYSFLQNGAINIKDPATLKETEIFNAKNVTYPGTNKPFEYESFQWSHDSKHLVFQTNFRRKYLRSGVSDYYIYDVDSKQLKEADTPERRYFLRKLVWKTR